MMTLTPPQQEERIGFFVDAVLDNFSMAWRLLDLLIIYGERRLPAPQATVLLRGLGPPANIDGANCGLFVNPVMTMAGVDCRRSLEFFGLRIDYGLNQLEPVTNRRPDDLGIEHFGLPMVSRQDFLKATASVLSRPVEPVLVEVRRWTDKQLAHFTFAESIVTLPEIRDASKVMIEAFMILLFDKSGRQRPQLNPS